MSQQHISLSFLLIFLGLNLYLKVRHDTFQQLVCSVQWFVSVGLYYSWQNCLCQIPAFGQEFNLFYLNFFYFFSYVLISCCSLLIECSQQLVKFYIYKFWFVNYNSLPQLMKVDKFLYLLCLMLFPFLLLFSFSFLFRVMDHHWSCWYCCFLFLLCVFLFS